jgi:signal transduction histidine kinase
LLAVSEVKTSNKHFFIGIIRDATVERQLQEQLRQSQKLEAVGQLTGGISHDFNNLLTVILGSAETLVDSLESDPQHRRHAEMILNAAERGAQLTNRLLSFSRRQPLLPKKVNVSDLLFGMEDLLRRSITQDVEIEIKTSVTPSIMEVDAAQLESAILNLALNSRDAMPNGGTLRIETSQLIVSDDAQAIPDELQPGSYLSIAVSDDGEGMDENQITHAFDPFFTTKEVGKGSGLGLSMVFGFVKQSGGHITIDSAQGKGTTIKMIFTCDFSAHEMQPLEGTTYG